MQTLPKARTLDLVTQHLEGEILLYDTRDHKALCLNQISATVWQHCDGKTSTKQLIDKYNLSEELIEIALDGLNKNNLLKNQIETKVPTDRVERRKFLMKAGAMAAVALPLISTIVAPQAAMAASCLAPGTSSTPFLDPNPTMQPDRNTCFSYCSTPRADSNCCSGSSQSDGSSYFPATNVCRCFLQSRCT